MSAEEAAKGPTGIAADIAAKFDMLDRLGVTVSTMTHPAQNKAGKFFGGVTRGHDMSRISELRIWEGQSADQLDATLDMALWRMANPSQLTLPRGYKPGSPMVCGPIDVQSIPAGALLGGRLSDREGEDDD